MAARERPTCSSQEGISPANKQGNSSDSSTPSKGEEETPRPTKKNKRKMSAPRKRTDVSASKRFCLADKVSELYGDDEDDMVVDAKELRSNSPEPSPSSDERNNSVESGRSPSPVQRPNSIAPQLLGSTVPNIYHTPVITSVGGVPRYALFPGLPPGFFPPPGIMPPGFMPVMSTSTPLPSPILDDRTPNHSMSTGNINNNNSKEASPSSCPTSAPSPSPSVCSGLDADSSMSGSRKQRKNYKNMTRERRIEANARERTRVHTISAAFESLRRAVPSYSYHQRLSKLAILRIACSYIMSLSRLADMDYSEEQNALSFADCVDLCTQTIQSEGRAKRRQ